MDTMVGGAAKPLQLQRYWCVHDIQLKFLSRMISKFFTKQTSILISSRSSASTTVPASLVAAIDHEWISPHHAWVADLLYACRYVSFLQCPVKTTRLNVHGRAVRRLADEPKEGVKEDMDPAFTKASWYTIMK
jgi:hypothetical protein